MLAIKKVGFVDYVTILNIELIHCPPQIPPDSAAPFGKQRDLEQIKQSELVSAKPRAGYETASWQ